MCTRNCRSQGLKHLPQNKYIVVYISIYTYFDFIKLKSVNDTLKPTTQRGKLSNIVQITPIHNKGFSLFISKEIAQWRCPIPP